MKETIKRHKKKAAAGAGILSVATLATVLQTAGILGPIVCSLPFIHDAQSCNATVVKVNEAATQIHALSGLTREDGSPLPLEEVDPDGGQ